MTNEHQAGSNGYLQLNKALMTAAAVICCSNAQAAAPNGGSTGSDGFRVEGGIRSRFEAIGGQFRPAAAEDDFLWSIRSSLAAEFDAGPVRFGGRLIDARGYGEEENSSAGTGEIDALELVEAYAAIEFGSGAGETGLLKVGRFQLQLGAGRLIAIQSFRNTANGFTGANLDWTNKGGDRLVAFWMMPQSRLPNDPDSLRHNEVQRDEETTNLQLFGASYTKAGLFGTGSLEAYAFKLNERDGEGTQSRNRHFATVGARAFRAPQKNDFDFDAEAAYQFGWTYGSAAPADVARLEVSAALVHAEVGRKLSAAWAPRLSLQFDYGTGGTDRPGRFRRFDSLYGSTRSDLGPVGLYGPLGRSNIISVGPRLEAKPSGRLDGFVSYRELWLENATDSFASTGVRDPAGQAARRAGRQIEARARYWLVPGMLRAELGGAVLDKGRFLKAAANARRTGDTRYSYIDLSVEF